MDSVYTTSSLMRQYDSGINNSKKLQPHNVTKYDPNWSTVDQHIENASPLNYLYPPTLKQMPRRYGLERLPGRAYHYSFEPTRVNIPANTKDQITDMSAYLEGSQEIEDMIDKQEQEAASPKTSQAIQLNELRRNVGLFQNMNEYFEKVDLTVDQPSGVEIWCKFFPLLIVIILIICLVIVKSRPN